MGPRGAPFTPKVLLLLPAAPLLLKLALLPGQLFLFLA